LSRTETAQGRIPALTADRGDRIFVENPPTYHIPVLPSRSEPLKSRGRARRRKTAMAVFGKKQSHRLWLAGPVDSLATIFHAWRWGRRQPGAADLMGPVYVSPQARLMIFMLDVSDSMADTLKLMRRWLAISMGEAYFRRDPVAIITIQGPAARLLVYPTTSIHFILHRLTAVSVGGATPLDEGLLMAGRMIRQWQDRYPVIDLIVLSDGRSTSSLEGPQVSASLTMIKKFVRQAVVINPIPIADRFARNLAALMGAKHICVQNAANSRTTGLNDV
jgi:magnesium chelatase subunit D